jgi:phage I-like protein
MKEQLIQLITAYGVAHASGNAILKQLAAGKIDAFLAAVEVVKPEPVAPEAVAAEVEAQ